jgi:hypothetical protein
MNSYSWNYFLDTHSLPPFQGEVPADTAARRTVGNWVPGDKTGYNQNFGNSFPWPGGKTTENFYRAMDTFALPGRPFLSLGELGTVYLNRPWRTLTFASTMTPGVDSALITSPPPTPATLYPTALLDYYTTIGTVTKDTGLFYRKPNTEVPLSPALNADEAASVAKREQANVWLFEDVNEDGTPTSDTKIRPIRGRVNLNTATAETLAILLKAPYRVSRSWGLELRGNTSAITVENWVEVPPADPPTTDMKATISDAIANQIAEGITQIRPLRSMADLAKLDLGTEETGPLDILKNLHRRTPAEGGLPDPVIDAIMARLAQFGTVRTQAYTVDLIARTLNTKVEERRAGGEQIPRVVNGEVRLQARVYFDTFSRKAFVESIEYR